MNPLPPNWDRLVAVDVETTGVNPFRHRILSAAFVPLDGATPNLDLYIRSDEPEWQSEARRYFAAFQTKWESEGISPRAACQRLQEYVAHHFHEPITLVGHNVGFDVAFLRQLAYLAELDQLPLVSHRAIDTHTILFLLRMRGLIPEDALSSTGAFSHFGIKIQAGERHTAIADASATRELFLRAISLLWNSETALGFDKRLMLRTIDDLQCALRT